VYGPECECVRYRTRDKKRYRLGGKDELSDKEPEDLWRQA
jgi:hypothetical protein